MLSKQLTGNLLHILLVFVCLLCVAVVGFLSQVTRLNSALPQFSVQLSCNGQTQTFNKPLNINTVNYHQAKLLHNKLCSDQGILNTFSDISIAWQTLPQLKTSHNIYPYDGLIIHSPYPRAIVARLFPNYTINALSSPAPLALYHNDTEPVVTTENLWASKVGVLASHWSVEHPFLTLALSRWGVMPEHLEIVTVEDQESLETRLYNGNINFMLAPGDIPTKANFKATALNINAPVPLLLLHNKHTNTPQFCLLAKQLVMPLPYQGLKTMTGCKI